MATQKDNSTAGFFALLLFLVAGLLVYVGHNGQFNAINDFSENDSKIDPSKADKIVNKYLQATNESIERKQLRRKIENDFTAPIVGQLVPISKQNKPLELDGPEDETQKEVKDSMSKDFTVDYVTPTSDIDAQLADKQQKLEYIRQAKERRIKEFVDNARQHGWSVEVDKNGVIRRSEPINQDDQQNIFAPTANDVSPQ